MSSTYKKFGMFKGVFIPTFLSIVGVILYLRLGRVVGQAGIFGTLAIIFLAVSVTFATALSLSSITTNIKIGSGGAYSIISKTLGLEVGGSIGVPLFLAQAFSVLLYIFGFTEAWTAIFTGHSELMVASLVLLSLFILTFISVRYAIRAQVAVFGLVCVSLLAIFFGGGWWEGTLRAQTIRMDNFWNLFALFFPAATGLMAGIGLSGELSDPKRQIPKGVMLGLGVSTLIYVMMVFWLGFSAPESVLLANSMVMVDLSIFGPVVILGILAATFSSALTTLVAAPRVLKALGGNSILPFSKFFEKTNDAGEPRNAILFTAVILALALPFSSLNSIAPFLTMFFLITYAMINLTVFLEQNLGFVSFRPTFKIPKIVPFYGALGSTIFMLYVDVLSGLVALGLILATYLVLVRKKLPSGEGHVRSGLLMAMSEWAARKVISLHESSEHIWKPNILFPISSPESVFQNNFDILKAITYPNGSLTALGLKEKGGDEEGVDIVGDFVEKLGDQGVFTSYVDVHADDYISGASVALEAMESQFFHPNILYLPEVPGTVRGREKVIHASEDAGTGLILFDKDDKAGLGDEEDINVWITTSMEDIDFYEGRTFDLALLIAYRLQDNWAGKIKLWTTQADNKIYLERLMYEARLPASTEIKVSDKTFRMAYKNAPPEDIHIIPFDNEGDLKDLMDKTGDIEKSNLFIKDSGHEDILA